LFRIRTGYRRIITFVGASGLQFLGLPVLALAGLRICVFNQLVGHGLEVAFLVFGHHAVLMEIIEIGLGHVLGRTAGITPFETIGAPLVNSAIGLLEYIILLPVLGILIILRKPADSRALTHRAASSRTLSIALPLNRAHLLST